MPFGLKNAGAIYQSAMNAIFHNMIGHHIEVYIDDIVAETFFGFLVHQWGVEINKNKAMDLFRLPEKIAYIGFLLQHIQKTRANFTTH